MNPKATLQYILDLALENTKGQDGYEMIVEWCYKTLKDCYLTEQETAKLKRMIEQSYSVAEPQEARG